MDGLQSHPTALPCGGAHGYRMTQIFRSISLAAALAVLTTLAACSTSSGIQPLEDPNAKPKQDSFATTYKGPRSPASAYCVQMGGALIDTPKGKNTICRWPDGKEVDPWDLYWRDNPLN